GARGIPTFVEEVPLDEHGGHLLTRDDRRGAPENERRWRNRRSAVVLAGRRPGIRGRRTVPRRTLFLQETSGVQDADEGADRRQQPGNGGEDAGYSGPECFAVQGSISFVARLKSASVDERGVDGPSTSLMRDTAV